MSEELDAQAVAIIGMSCRVPGASDMHQFWQNLCNGVESISSFTIEELQEAGVNPAALEHKNYVRNRGVVDGIEYFDAAFFGFSPREAAIMDPQHRFFLECAWEVLEDAGYDPSRYQGAIGVFAGSSMNGYLSNVFSDHEVVRLVGGVQIAIGNDKDHLPARVAYKLNLRGPAMAVQTACSTSLVAVSIACQSLLSYQCDMALAGGVSLGVPQRVGYLYQEGGINSPDGHCRAFDARAQGTVGGNGVGIVVLKRLSEAVADGDHIYAVIRGFGLNNDGSAKVGYTAPSVDGQAEAIVTAQAFAGVSADTVSYVEAHGTGTPLGDPIEVAALTQAFRSTTQRVRFCALGSVKTNIGHLDAAAGVAGLIKTTLALQHRLIPPSLHFEHPNPTIDFDGSPFYINTSLQEWKSTAGPRRAGVSSFGIGGTNAHVVLEEAPAVEASERSSGTQVIPLSARTASALEVASSNLATHLERHVDLNLSDVAYTLQVGRRAFNHRRVVIASDREEVVKALRTNELGNVFTSSEEAKPRSVAFLFPGQGTQHVNMALEIYRDQPSFRAHVDTCCELFEPHLGVDLRRILYPKPGVPDEQQLTQTQLAQPALFAIEYALARLWMEWGITPSAMIGHSIGEYVAACVAGVYSLEHGVALVAARARLMHQVPPGAMLAVPLPEEEARSLATGALSLAAVNAAALSVLSGPVDAIRGLQAQLANQDVESHVLRTSHAFHSAMMDPILEPFRREVAAVPLHAPEIPYLSNVTGTWITSQDAQDPDYWGRHLRHTVRFADGIRQLMRDPDRILLEVGPGETLSSLARREDTDRVVLSSLPATRRNAAVEPWLMATLGQLWSSGVEVAWEALHSGRRRRLPLPPYPFERQRCWIDRQRPPDRILVGAQGNQSGDIRASLYAPSWKRTIPFPPTPSRAKSCDEHCLLFGSSDDLTMGLARRLRECGYRVTLVTRGDRFSPMEGGGYQINPAEERDYEVMMADIRASGETLGLIVHLWSAAADGEEEAGFEEAQERGLFSLLCLARTLSHHGHTGRVQIAVVSDGVQAVTGDERLVPERATLLAPCKVLPQEYPHVSCRSIDIQLSPSGDWRERLLDQLTAEVIAEHSDPVVALRKGHRWIQVFEPIAQEHVPAPCLREEGVYLITGGLGRIGLALAEQLARSIRARLVLVGHSPFPTRDRWPEWVETYGDDHPTSRVMRRILAMEETGARVAVITADVGDMLQMQQVISHVYAEFGALHGVIHGAGVTRKATFRTILDMDRDTCEQQFRPKVYGLEVLDHVLHSKDLDFCVLLSSLSTVLGGLGFAAYAAANLYMDAFVERKAQDGARTWISVNWDGWQFGARPDTVGTALHADDGWEAFRHIISMDLGPRLVVATGDLQTRIEQWVKLETARDALRAETPAADQAGRHAQTASVAPRDEVERTVIDLWQRLLGVQHIGVHDDFFDLGGHSLLAIQLLSRLRDIFQVDLSIQQLFIAPTVAQIAEEIGRARESNQSDADKVARMLAMVEQMSEDELHGLLGQHEGQ